MFRSFRKGTLVTIGTLDVGALAAYEAAEYLIRGDFASAEAALRIVQRRYRAAHPRRTRDLVAAHHQARRRAPEDSYQLQLQLSERREPTQALKCIQG